MASSSDGSSRQQIPWLRIGAEGVAIVVSILLAFGIQAWWEDRKERQEERRVLSSLHAELVTNRQRLMEAKAFQEGIRDAILQLLEEAVLPAPVAEPDSVDRLLAKASWFNNASNFQMSASDAVIQGGRLALIGDESVRESITDWNREVAFVTRQEEQDHALHLGVWMPFLREHSYLPQINNSTTDTPTGEPGYNSVVPLPSASSDHRGLLEDAEFHNVLQQRLWAQDDIIISYERLEPRLVSLTHLLADEMGR